MSRPWLIHLVIGTLGYVAWSLANVGIARRGQRFLSNRATIPIRPPLVPDAGRARAVPPEPPDARTPSGRLRGGDRGGARCRKCAVAGDTGPELVLFALGDFAAGGEAARDALSEADSDGQRGRAECEAWAGKHPLLKQMFGLSEALFGAEQ